MKALTTMPSYKAPPATIKHLEVIKSNFGIIQAAMSSVLIKNIHFGVIPGTGQSKPVLLKPGADVLCSLFHFAPKYEATQNDLGNEHREYIVNCSLYDMAGNKLGEGLGLCSTMEKKYRYRTGEGEVTDIPVPKDYWDVRNSDPAKAAKILTETANKGGHPGQKFSTKKNNEGQWRIATFGERVENDCIADVYNTCIKMAAKRSLISAVLTVTGASAVFTQDIEDMSGSIIEGDFEEWSPKDFPDEEPEPEPDLEALFSELVVKAGLTTKQEKADLSKFVEITAQAQSRSAVDIIQSALSKHFESFAIAFGKWQQANEPKPKVKSTTRKEEPKAPESKGEATAEVNQEEQPAISRETLEAVEKELSRLAVPGQLPPDLVSLYGTGDPSELSESQGQEALKNLKNFAG